MPWDSRSGVVGGSENEKNCRLRRLFAWQALSSHREISASGVKVKETLSVFLFFFRKALLLSFSTISQPFFLARENLSSFPLVGRCCRGTFGGASLLRTQLCQHAHGFQPCLAQKRNPLRSHPRRSGTQTSSAATLRSNRTSRSWRNTYAHQDKSFIFKE